MSLRPRTCQGQISTNLDKSHKWVTSRNVTDYKDLRNLIILEDFKSSLPKDIQTHLDDLDVTDVREAAKRCDDYSVTHRLTQANFASRPQGFQKRNDRSQNTHSGSNTNNTGQVAQSKGQDKTSRQPGARPTDNKRPYTPYDSNAFCSHHQSQRSQHRKLYCTAENPTKGYSRDGISCAAKRGIQSLIRP